jgi:SARP family transcriptional regulator, regulator of embCAB operon
VIALHVLLDHVSDILSRFATSDVAALADDLFGHGSSFLACVAHHTHDWSIRSDILLAPTLTRQHSTRIQVCGRLAVEIGGRSVTDLVPRRQGRLLFTYLVLNRHRHAGRDELVDTLWQDDAPPDADAALSTVMSRLRRAIGAEALVGRGEVRLVLPADAWVDVEAAEEAIHRAEAAIAQGRWAPAWAPSLVALFVARRGLLRGEDARWIEPHRRRLDDIHCSALECYTAAALGLGGSELHVGERTARELIARVPYRESGHRLLMEVLAARGNIAEALRAYEGLRFLLREELGATPSPQIQAVHLRLLKAADAG